MKLYVFGSCAGTEPYPARHHCSFAIETGGGLYWFDAGENCSYTAHLMGVDLMKLRHVFISHTHMDHVGGLGNLFWNVRKIDQLSIYPDLESEVIGLHLPDIRPWQGIAQLLAYTEGGFESRFSIDVSEYTDGLVLEDAAIRVTALHNHHLKHEEGTPWRSFGFRIEAEGKVIVYSGDTGGADDYAPLMEGCDLLLTETGHHHPWEVASDLLEKGIFPGTLAFIHHGRDFLDRYEQSREALEKVCAGSERPVRYLILEDAQTIEL